MPPHPLTISIRRLGSLFFSLRVLFAHYIPLSNDRLRGFREPEFVMNYGILRYFPTALWIYIHILTPMFALFPHIHHSSDFLYLSIFSLWKHG